MRLFLAIAVMALSGMALAGCSALWDYSPRTPLEEEADYMWTRSSYKQLATARLKDLKYSGGFTASAISPLRKSHSVAFADWMACVQGEGEGHRRTFAIFYRERKVADLRLAVVIDGCDGENFERF
jgi:hypothetical protein